MVNTRDGQGIGINGEGTIPPGIKRDRDDFSREGGKTLSLFIPSKSGSSCQTEVAPYNWNIIY